MLSFVIVFGLIVAPFVLLGIGYFYAIQAASRCRSAARPFLLCPPICSFVLTSGYMLWGYRAILTSKSSTAAVGLFLMPIFSLAVAIAGLAVSWSVLYAAHFVVQRIKQTPLGLTSLVLFALAIVVIVLTGYMVQGKVARHPEANHPPSVYTNTATARLPTTRPRVREPRPGSRRGPPYKSSSFVQNHTSPYPGLRSSFRWRCPDAPE